MIRSRVATLTLFGVPFCRPPIRMPFAGAIQFSVPRTRATTCRASGERSDDLPASASSAATICQLAIGVSDDDKARVPLALPGWPALLSAEQAAADCGMSRESFATCIDAGLFPGPVDLPIRRRLWSRAAIDAALTSEPADDYDARRAAHEARIDSIVRDINARATARALDRSRTPAERKAHREQERRAHAERAAERARKATARKHD
jgi:predicted DNA-binding transcriptional regulator AlpA